MSSSSEERWQLRFENYGRALTRLRNACEKEDYSELEVAGLVHTFGFTFNLAWNVLKDLLYYEGTDTGTPRQAIESAFTAELISEEDSTTLLHAMVNRNRLEHIYDEEEAQAAIALIKETYLPMFNRFFAELDARRTR